MKAIWISFCKALIPSVMDGTKILTSRVIKPQPKNAVGIGYRQDWEYYERMTDPITSEFSYFQFRKVGKTGRCPYGDPGDLLKVRESYRIHGTRLDRRVIGVYLADGAEFDVRLTGAEWERFKVRKFPYRAMPGRFMYASLWRTMLTNRSTTIARIQGISKKEAIWEGIRWNDSFPEGYIAPGCPRGFGAAEDAFFWLWDSINAKRGFPFSANSWTWKIRLEVKK